MRKSKIAYLSMILALLLIVSGCAPRNDIQQSSQPSTQQTDGIKEAAPDEGELQSMREYAITFAESFSEPFASVDDLDLVALGRFAMMQLYLAHEKELETDDAGYPYIPNALLKDYMSSRFGMENYIYPQQPQSEKFTVLPLYDAEKDAYLFGAAGDGSLVKAEITEETLLGQTAVYTMRMERQDFETGKAAEVFEMDYHFLIVSAEQGYALQAASAERHDKAGALGDAAEGKPASVPSDTFYPAAAAYQEYDGSAIRGRHGWNEDGTLTFQHQNTLTTLSVDNQAVETITLPLEHLPSDGGYELTWSGSLVLALDNQAISHEQYGVVYFTDDGGVHLANMTLFDRQGNLIRQYPQGKIGEWDASDRYVYLLPCPEGTEIIGAYNLSRAVNVHWLDDDTVIFECHSRVVLYDFAADSGRILDDMSALVEKYGTTGASVGLSFGIGGGGVLDGRYYYIAYRNEEKFDTEGVICCADENGAVELFGGKEFWHLAVGDNVLMLSDHIDSADYESDDRFYAAKPDSHELTEVLSGKLSVPYVDNDVIGFSNLNSRGEDGAILYAYDYRSGELHTHSLGRPVQINEVIAKMVDGSLRYYYTLFEDGEATDWAYDTATDTTTELTEHNLHKLDDISFSPDGRYFVEYNAGYVEYDPESEQPLLRVSLWIY